LKQLQDSDARRLVRTLDQEIRSRGRGSIRAVDRAAGYREGWWQHRAASGDIGLRQLLEVLDHLGLHPVGFLRKALGTEGDLELDRPRGLPPEIVAKALDRLNGGEERSGIGKTFLDTLDHRRYSEPREVAKLSAWAVDHAELALLPGLLGVAGSALRLLIQLDEAEHAIHAGIEIAEQQGDRVSVGNLLRRLSYVVADRGDRGEAFRLAERAALLFLRLGDSCGLGKATVEQGIWLYYLGRFEESIEAHKSALALLPESCASYLCTVHQYLGLNCRELGRPQEALRYVADADRIAVAAGIEEWARSKLVWLRARICSDLGELDEAALLFSAVAERFRTLHRGEAALATCELVRIHLLRKRPGEAYLAATSMRALVEPLRHNKIISAAISDLLRCGRSGLTLALVQRVQLRIEDERKHHQKMWQSLTASKKST
jgi:tetratricopeptide (TPR) repeat protein